MSPLPATASFSSDLPPCVREIVGDLDLAITECVRIPRERDDLVEQLRIEAEQGTFFLKLSRPENGALKNLFHRLFGRPSMRRQIAVHAALQQVEHRHLRIPRLVDADIDRFMLMEYLPLAADGRREPDRGTLVAALLEFQRTDATVGSRDPGLVLLDVVLHPEVRAARAVLTALRRRLGARTAMECLRVLWRCRRSQPALDRSVLVHNDFHPENVLMGSDGEMYLSDFENVTATRRWLLMDIVHYAVSTHEAHVDVGLIQRYVAALRQDPNVSADVRFEAQVRFALLRRVVQHITTAAPPEPVRASYARFLTDTLLPDGAFRDWYADRFA